MSDEIDAKVIEPIRAKGFRDAAYMLARVREIGLTPQKDLSDEDISMYMSYLASDNPADWLLKQADRLEYENQYGEPND